MKDEMPECKKLLNVRHSGKWLDQALRELVQADKSVVKNAAIDSKQYHEVSNPRGIRT